VDKIKLLPLLGLVGCSISSGCNGRERLAGGALFCTGFMAFWVTIKEAELINSGPQSALSP